MLDTVTQAAIDARYTNSFGRAAGYLPRDRKAVDAWLARHADRTRDRKEALSPSVAALKRVIEADRTSSRWWPVCSNNCRVSSSRSRASTTC
ncbi:hypothetical protein [Kitasatospora kifunensis]|uniref:Uncharacterized protein n=1 Tax=Kitasatospora kifunensis TaxID=58351 RepID=A0A7W7R913_KITKI|nr:hypothetical protein [Kitasatospora kifunensis]MBB4927667.1 hypothetical protein [Kitasatospora kifunensis]